MVQKSNYISYFTLLQGMMELSAYPEVIKTCIEASRLHPSDSTEFNTILRAAHPSYGGKKEGIGYPQGKTALGHYTGWIDKIEHHEDDYRFAFPDHTPVFLIRFLAMIIQTGCDPLEHPVISPLMPHKLSKSKWSLNGMVSGPIKSLQILGIDVFADSRFDTWVLLTMW